MSAARKPSAGRLFVLAATTVAFVIGIAVVVAAKTAGPASKSNATATKQNVRGNKAEEQNERIQKMAKRLKLSDDQVAKVQSIMQAGWTEMSDLRAKYDSQPRTPENKAAMEQARKDLHEKTQASLAQVLTADQMTEFKKMRAEHKHGEWGKGEKGEKDEAKERKI